MRLHRTALLASWVALASAACSRGPTPSADAGPSPSAATSAAAPHTEADLKKLSVDEVDQLIQENTGKAFIYDNNPKEIFDAGHLPTATWMNFNSVAADVLPKDKAATLVFYCANEAWHACHTAAVAAENLGYANVYVMPGGIRGWKRAGKAVETG